MDGWPGSASEFQDRVGEALDRSLSQPVSSLRMAGPAAYDEYRRLKARDRQAMRTEDLSEEEIAAIEASEMAPGFDHLNAELDGT